MSSVGDEEWNVELEEHAPKKSATLRRQRTGGGRAISFSRKPGGGGGALDLQQLGAMLDADDDEAELDVDLLVHEALTRAAKIQASQEKSTKEVIARAEAETKKISDSLWKSINGGTSGLEEFLSSLDFSKTNVSSFDSSKIQVVNTPVPLCLTADEIGTWIDVLHETFGTERCEAFSRMLRNRALTCLQLRIILRSFDLDFEKMELCIIAHSFLGDKESFEEVVLRLFAFESERSTIREQITSRS